MNNWEYHQEWVTGKTSGGLIRSRQLKDSSEALSQMNELGKQRWELVSTVPYISINGLEAYILFFKRPVI